MRGPPVLHDKLMQRIFARAEHPARIDERKRRALPLCGLGDHVSRRAGNRRHDRASRADDAIEERGLADVGSADQHDG